MTDYEIISILQDLRRSKFSCKYSDLQYNLAIEYAINKIRNYHDLLTNYITLSKSYADFKEYAKHNTPLRDNY